MSDVAGSWSSGGGRSEYFAGENFLEIGFRVLFAESVFEGRAESAKCYCVRDGAAFENFFIGHGCYLFFRAKSDDVLGQLVLMHEALHRVINILISMYGRCCAAANQELFCDELPKLYCASIDALGVKCSSASSLVVQEVVCAR